MKQFFFLLFCLVQPHLLDENLIDMTTQMTNALQSIRETARERERSV